MLPPAVNQKRPNPREDFLQSNLQKIRAEEREYLAHSLHDSICPLLAIARMNLEAISQQSDTDGSKELLINNTLALIQHTMEEVKYLTNDLQYLSAPSFNLKVKLEDLCQKINDTRVLYVSLKVGMGIPIFNATMGTELFNILKELLHNTIKHANASKVKISLLQSNGILMLTYKDNGNGCIPKTIRKQKKLGLNSIYQRLQKIQGRFQIKATPGLGFRLTANIPLSFEHLK